ncbi:hypothetical protein TBLA_0A02550 [Henningerozyma blattae CBS 6284]|uniref:Calcineurin-like phosphoesterase domain-containing protein n=1 Tax=Henningerozyma blattae (strain ATCC 34711 / CBS 6284 / DSM 70876 / NBRC 10599 / NRRL Y-10934 / UCD 77-7) TaxID=1071380 RepID=I2GVA2_HENB6|nr:hypothetical protein TBLA_0A02550 [Tetrapisispora blattae CBS 6284]CCH58054.1 hypothetical protein TBLA_0A02550 [Tetrapisispora blattae CBS 6284]
MVPQRKLLKVFKKTTYLTTFLLLCIAWSRLRLFFLNVKSQPNAVEYNGGLIDDIKLMKCYRWYKNCETLYAQSAVHDNSFVLWNRVSKNMTDSSLYAIESNWLYETFFYVHLFNTNANKEDEKQPLADIAVSRDPSLVPLTVLQEVMPSLRSSDSMMGNKRLYYQKTSWWYRFWNNPLPTKMNLMNKWKHNNDILWSKIQHDSCLITNIQLYLGSNFVESRPFWKEIIHELHNEDGNSIPISITRKVECGFDANHTFPKNTINNKDLLQLKQKSDLKILQLSDIHIKGNEENSAILGEFQSRIFISRIIDIERPDLVVITGDILDGNKSVDYQTCILNVVQPIIRAQIPFVISFGAKDFSKYATQQEITDFVNQIPYCLNKNSDSNGHLTIPYNFSTIPNDSKDDYSNLITQNDLAIFIFNSKTSKRQFFKDYISLYKSPPKLALAFQYLPIPTYRLSGVFPIIGQYNERNLLPEGFDNDDNLINYMHEMNIKALSCGFDHSNDCCLQSIHDIWLCYSGATGLTAPHSIFMPPSVRLFKVDNIDKSITSWKRNYNKIDEVYDYQYIYNQPKQKHTPSN